MIFEPDKIGDWKQDSSGETDWWLVICNWEQDKDKIGDWEQDKDEMGDWEQNKDKIGDWEQDKDRTWANV